MWIRMAILKTNKQKRQEPYREDVAKRELLDIAGRITKWSNHFGKSLAFS